MAARKQAADARKKAEKDRVERERPRGVYIHNGADWKTARCGGKSNVDGACSTNGVCVANKCECIEGFMGDDCSQRDLGNFPKLNSMVVVKGSRGQNCHEACQSNGKTCDPKYLPVLNSCGELRKAFGCKNNKPNQCSKSFGPDQPLFVDDSTTIAKFGECLQNTIKSYFGCSGKYQWGLRLCPCF